MRRFMRPALLMGFATLVTLAVLLQARMKHTQLFRQGTYVFGTRVELTLYGISDSQARVATQAVFQRFTELHHQLHAWQPSELTALNAAIAADKPFIASPRLAAILRAARRLTLESGGSFDPGVGRLIGAWGFQRETFNDFIPDPVAIQALSATHPTLLDLDISNNGRIRSSNRKVAIDLGGYAKGWALDEAADILRAQGVTNALIDIGGNVMALGSKDGTPWRVGVQHPRRPGAMASIDLRDGEAMGTSGDYYRYYMKGGVRYSHIIDPRTGAPARASQAVTVLIAPGRGAGALSDGASKPLFISGPAAATHVAQVMGVEDFLLVDAQGRVFTSPQMRARMVWQDPRTPMQNLTSTAGPA